MLLFAFYNITQVLGIGGHARTEHGATMAVLDFCKGGIQKKHECEQEFGATPTLGVQYTSEEVGHYMYVTNHMPNEHSLHALVHIIMRARSTAHAKLNHMPNEHSLHALMHIIMRARSTVHAKPAL